MFIGIWNFADDHGRYVWRPKQIKMQIFPADDFSVQQVDGWLIELENNGLIASYTVDDEKFFVITGWHHQKIDKRQKPRYPDPKFDEYSGNGSRIVPECSSRIGREGKGEEGSKKPPKEESNRIEHSSGLAVVELDDYPRCARSSGGDK